ncbi:MAG: hypothetical protein IT165_05660 [Bryobacterales bacterium]|nr:hypothetical protein [Bryobacterales bacterium]
MPRLIDRLLAAEKWRTESFSLPQSAPNPFTKLAAGIRADLGNATVLVIDNVAQYFFAHHSHSDGRLDGPEQFPHLAPPFPCAFYEYTLDPSMYRRMFTNAKNGAAQMINQVGILVQSVDAEQTRSWIPDLSSILGEHISGSSRWAQAISVFVRQNADRDVFGPCALLCIGVSADGRSTSPLRCRPWGLSDEAYDLLPDELLLSMERLGGLALPALLATSFLHCRNVSTQQNVPPPKLSKAFNRRQGRPLVQFKTLAIEPMKEVLRKQGRVEQNGLSKALHLCRGHFKDYRNSAGLFGKHKGLFWWDLHARGELEHGAVVKDYAIKLAN